MFFRSKSQTTALDVSLELARLEIEGNFNKSSSITRWQEGIKALWEVNKLLEIPDCPTMQSTSSDPGVEVDAQIENCCLAGHSDNG
ncbi:hypothetical protein R1flu_023514 [Riccia fluitans]|uniref:Uncharacterized protein n=1 Tax=Riccia fluitans TaxID=41844 RepID=A0ABD1XS93_9MARC